MKINQFIQRIHSNINTILSTTILIILVSTAQQCDKKITPAQDFQFKTPAHFGKTYVIPETNPMTQEGVELGRMLFYEHALSRDSSLSCATCHQQALAFTDGMDVSIGIDGQSLDRSAMSLVNLLWVNQFFWDGRAESLEEQALIPLTDPREMDMNLEEAVNRLQNSALYPPLFKKAFGTKKINPILIARALGQFQRTLISSDSRYDKIINGELTPTLDEQRAINLFMTHPVPEVSIRGGNCGDCHGSHLTTLNTFHNNGLDSKPKDPGLKRITDDPYDLGKMRAPSLRNIALTAPYMHDGRFKTLEEVLDHYNEHIQYSDYLDPLIMEATNEVDGESLLLTEQEKQDILLFLHLLTDSTFIQNPKFSDPFTKEN